ncbi:MAG: hypothetical protein IT373_29330 [Polyangiaceae bacterium]|nr:hypothetical protein [Polyangiaceae bacterium]
MSQNWCGVRYAGGGHLESYFIKAVDPSSTRAFWLKATIFAEVSRHGGAPRAPLAEAWAISFDHRDGRRHVAAKHQLPLSEASFERDGLGVRWRTAAGESLAIEPGRTRGEVRSGGRTLRWDLAFAGDERPMVPLPLPSLYRGPFPSTKLVTPYPDVRFTGELDAGGERWSVEGWRGMLGHNWGRRHGEQYAWSHCNQWEEDDELVLELAVARVRAGGVLLPALTIACLRHRGVDYDFNQPLALLRNRGSMDLRSVRFAAASRFGRIAGEIAADTEDFVGLYYPNPGGAMTHCLNTKLARAHLRFEAAGRPPLVVTSRAAALEIATLRPDHGVRMSV